MADANGEGPGPPSYRITRFLILRLLGMVYFVAFLTAVDQGPALIGSDGLTPADAWLERLEHAAPSRAEAVWRTPTLFWIDASDPVQHALAVLGAAGALALALGWANGALLAALWVLYLSFKQIGQIWYGFGWEIQLLETGFLAIFLVPFLDGRPFPSRAPPRAVIWLFRWLAFRVMLGSGLIKLRGDPCWRDLTCLRYHWQTQPIPGPLSRLFHFLPDPVQRLGVLFNHLAELVAPWFLFWPRTARAVAGSVVIAFQAGLIASGNLSFLNWLTIVPALACFDDAQLRRVVPRALARRAERSAEGAPPPTLGRRAVVAVLVAVVAVLSVAPVRNLFAREQRMNASFDRWYLVNTYGAFGSVSRERHEIVFEGTTDPAPGPDTRWIPYEFECKPGNPARRPCWITPYHYRLDWLAWFAAMSSPARHPWSVHLVWKLLQADPETLDLLAANPFPGRAPRFVRARLYRYEFAPPDDPSGDWWRREEIGPWLPALSADDPRLRRFLAEHGWLPADED